MHSSLLLDVQLYSSSIKTVKQVGLDGMISCPVFGDHDKVEGKVIIGPNCSQNGRLNISVSLTYTMSYTREPNYYYCRLKACLSMSL